MTDTDKPASGLDEHLDALEVLVAARHAASQLRMEAISEEIGRQARRRRWLHPLMIGWAVVMLGLQAYGIATDTGWAVFVSMVGITVAALAVFTLLRWELIALRSAGS